MTDRERIEVLASALRMAAETCDNVADTLAVQHQHQTKETQWLNEVVAVAKDALAKAAQ